MKDYSAFIGIKKSRLIVKSCGSEFIYGEKRMVFTCICDCGNTIKCTVSHFKARDNISCGCLKAERTASQTLIDGRRNKPEYIIWASIIQRCFNEKSRSYKYYGGRGITMCAEWRNDFANFLKDMGERPSRDLSIDRINNDGNYEPSNCRWATRIQQMNNTRRNK